MRSKPSWILASGIVLGLTACAPAAPANPQPIARPPVAGGWSAASVSPDVKAAAAFAVSAMNRPGAKLKSVQSAETQVVAGMNYKINLTLADRSKWQVVVYRNLQGAYSLTSATQR